LWNVQAQRPRESFALARQKPSSTKEAIEIAPVQMNVSIDAERNAIRIGASS
jgi:hypothetical protein